MQYLKRKNKFTIIAFTIIIFILAINLSSIAKTQICFSLTDNPQKAIIKNINQAEVFINIAMYVFTDKEIATSLIDAHNRGVKVRVYLDKSQIDFKYSRSCFLVQKGIKVRISTNNYIMHNKFAIIDNRILITGSYNWTFSANQRNDENLMVINDSEVITRYQQQFENLWTNKRSLNRTRQLYQKANVNFTSTRSFPTSLKIEDRMININDASQEKFMKVLQIGKLFAQRIISLREELGEFKEPRELLQLPEITKLEWDEWEEEGIIITVK